MTVGFSDGEQETAHVYTLPSLAEVVLVTLGTREDNLARVQEAYAAWGWRLVGRVLVPVEEIAE